MSAQTEHYDAWSSSDGEVGFTPLSASSLRWSKLQAKEALSAWIRLLELPDLHARLARTELFHERSAAHDLWLIEDGLVLLTCAQPDGEETVFGLRLPGQLLDQCASAHRSPHRYSALTLTTCMLRRIDAAMLRERELTDPGVARLVLRQLRTDLHNAASYILQLKVQTLEQRFRQLVRLLAAVFDAHPVDGVMHLPVPLREEEIAGLLGASVRQFKRVKKQMRERGDLEICHQHELAMRWAGQS